MARLNSRERSSISRAFGVSRTYIRNWRSLDAPGHFALDGVDALDERQAVAERLSRRVGQRRRHQRVRDRVECRLRGEAEDIVVERARIHALAGHLDESRHPVVDELLPAFVELEYAPAEASWRLLGDEHHRQPADEHAGNDPRGAAEPGQRHSCESLSAQKASALVQPACLGFNACGGGFPLACGPDVRPCRGISRMAAGGGSGIRMEPSTRHVHQRR